jgi:hypothetical protein
MALFARMHNEIGNSECYFSPACSTNILMKTLIDSYKGQPCEKPVNDENASITKKLVLLFGHNSAQAFLS